LRQRRVDCSTWHVRISWFCSRLGCPSRGRTTDAKVTRPLTGFLTLGEPLVALLVAIREREQRLEVVKAAVQSARMDTTAWDLPLDAVMAEVRRRFADWQGVLAEESTHARQMLRTLLRDRLVFTPDLDHRACDYNGEGDLSELIRGVVSLPKALASPTGTVEDCTVEARGKIAA
jgi:hypothetical protein